MKQANSHSDMNEILEQYQNESKINISESGNGKCVDCKKPALIGNYWCGACAYNHFRQTYSDYKKK